MRLRRDKTFLIWFLVLITTQKKRGRVDMRVAELNKTIPSKIPGLFWLRTQLPEAGAYSCTRISDFETSFGASETRKCSFWQPKSKNHRIYPFFNESDLVLKNYFFCGFFLAATQKKHAYTKLLAWKSLKSLNFWCTYWGVVGTTLTGWVEFQSIYIYFLVFKK